MATTYPHMTREQWLQWADALDSGRFAQIQESLAHTPPGGGNDWTRVCCLGACTVTLHGKDYRYPGTMGLMTQHQSDFFVGLNDHKGYTFAQIAAAIRENIVTFVAGEVPVLVGAE